MGTKPKASNTQHPLGVFTLIRTFRRQVSPQNKSHQYDELVESVFDRLKMATRRKLTTHIESLDTRSRGLLSMISTDVSYYATEEGVNTFCQFVEMTPLPSLEPQVVQPDFNLKIDSGLSSQSMSLNPQKQIRHTSAFSWNGREWEIFSRRAAFAKKA